MKMRAPCAKCSSDVGYIREANGQDVVRCMGCDGFQYNAPRVETGRAVRTVETVHKAVKPKVRARVMMLAGGMCQLCGHRRELQVGHVLSVKDGLEQGLTERDLNHPANLVALCAACNLGMGDLSMSPRLLAAITRAALACARPPKEPAT